MAGILVTRNSIIADIMRTCGRLNEAAAALEEAIEVQRVARIHRPNPEPYVKLAQVCVEMGQFQRALEFGRQAERLLQTLKASRSLTRHLESSMTTVLAALASAYEGLGRAEECVTYHKRALDNMTRMQVWYADAYSVCKRHALILVETGQLEEAEDLLNRAALRNYREMLEVSVSATLANVGFKYMLSALRYLVDIKRRLGKEGEARALEQDLDETDAILPSMSAAALNELREEMREEKKKKLTRKQQKRKAAQRRKAEARAAAAGAKMAEGGKTKEAGDVEAVAAATAQLHIEVIEPEPEPEPEPEECAICLNDLPLPGEEEGAVLLACSHTFHTSCLERWKDKCLEKALPYTCAMCRRPVTAATGGEGK